MNKIQNLKEFKELIDTYESITLEQLQRTYTDLVKEYEQEHEISPVTSLSSITGFGSIGTCSLCKAVKGDCNFCVYGVIYEADGDFYPYCNIHKTYDNIVDANTLEELHLAIKERAKYMKEFLLINNLK